MTGGNPSNVVILVEASGKALAILDTDRSEFPGIATWSRDRIFLRAASGDLGKFGAPGWVGAIYVETKPWRISMATLDKPTCQNRRRKSAVILPFLARSTT